MKKEYFETAKKPKKPFVKKSMSINENELKALSRHYKIKPKMMRHLIYQGILTPLLNTEDDWSKLEGFGRVMRDAQFTRYLLAWYSKDQREDLCRKTSMTSKEAFIHSLFWNKGYGKVLTVRQACATVYNREGRVFSYNKDDEARELYETVRKIREKVKNQKKTARRVGEVPVPFLAEEEYI